MLRRELEQALEAIEPETKAARVREVMPVIERKLAAGVRLATILEVLSRAGLELSLATLKSYLYQYRKRNGRLAPATAAPSPLDSAIATNVSSRVATSPAPPAQSADTSVDRAHEPEQPPARAADGNSEPVEPVSMLEFARLLRPDPVKSNEDAARYARLTRDRLARERQRRSKPP